MSTASKKGTDLILMIGDSDQNVEEFAAQRDATMSTEYDELEASNKLSPDDKGEWQQGRGNATLDIDAVGILDDAAAFDIQDVHDAAYNGTNLVLHQYLNEDGTIYFKMDAFFTSAEYSFPDNDIFTISGTLRITGGWEIVDETGT